MIEPADVPKPRVRPTAIVRVAIREAAQAGLDIEVRTDGTIFLRQPSPKSTGQAVAGGKGVVL